MASSILSFFFPFITLCLLFLVPTLSSDPDLLQDFCIADLASKPSINGFPCKPAEDVTAEDFFFSGFKKRGNISNPNGVAVTPGNVLSFPAVNTLGLSMNRVDLLPGGINPPHSHPRATESGVVVNGKVLVGFVTSSNVFYSKVLTPPEMFVIPRGLVHFQQNVGDEKAILFTAFNSQLPGTVLVANTVFGSKPGIPDEVLAKAFQTDNGVIDSIKSKFGM